MEPESFRKTREGETEMWLNIQTLKHYNRKRCVVGKRQMTVKGKKTPSVAGYGEVYSCCREKEKTRQQGRVKVAGAARIQKKLPEIRWSCKTRCYPKTGIEIRRDRKRTRKKKR